MDGGFWPVRPLLWKLALFLFAVSPFPSLSRLQRLAVTWRVIGLIAVAFTRLMRRYEDGRTAGAQPQAERLELCLRAAHILLIHEISEAREAAPAETAADTDALDFLRMVCACLLAIAFVIRNIIARGLAGAPGWILARMFYLPPPQASRVLNLGSTPPICDSS